MNGRLRAALPLLLDILISTVGYFARDPHCLLEDDAALPAACGKLHRCDEPHALVGHFGAFGRMR